MSHPDAGTTPVEEILCRMLYDPGFIDEARTNTAIRRLFRGQGEALSLFNALCRVEVRAGFPQITKGTDLPEDARTLYYQLVMRPPVPSRVLKLFPSATEMPTSSGDLAGDQIADATALMRRDQSTGVRWTWPELNRVMGPILPGEVCVVGALPGNGKTSFLMGQMDALAMQGISVLYVPLELDPAQCRLRWAAWRLGYPIDRVVRQEWAILPEGAEEEVARLIDNQRAMGHIQFASPKRLTIDGLTKWCEWAKGEYGARVVIPDHLHRLDVAAGARDHRVGVTDMARRLKDLARDLELQFIVAAQLNRTSDPLDAYMAPTPGRLKESGAIFEEADTVIMLSRKLRRDLPKDWKNRLLVGQVTERDLEEPGVMVATCRKHRLDDEARDRRVYLRVVGGRVESREQYQTELVPEPPAKPTEPEVPEALALPGLDP